MIVPSMKYNISEVSLNDYHFVSTLHIKSLNKNDFAQYVCVAKNTIGKSEIFSVTFIGKDKVQFKGRFGKYLVAELNGRVNANRDVPGAWETWTVEKRGKWQFAFKSFHGKYLVAEPNGELNANRNVASEWETFRVVTCPAWLGLGICK